MSTSTALRHRPRRRHRLLRVTLWVCASTVVIAALGLWLVTRSWFLVALIEPRLERRLGGDIEIGRISYEGAGCILVENATLQSRHHKGPAAEVVHIEKALVVVDVASLFKMKVEILGVEVGDVRLRLSEDVRESGQFSFMSLEPNWTMDERADPVLPPYVTIRRALIEVGSHDGDQYEVIGQRWVEGGMAPLVEADQWFGFSLTEVHTDEVATPAAALKITGRWNVATNAYDSRIEGLDMTERTYVMCPSMARLWWDRMSLEGSISGMTIGWEPTEPFSVAFNVENVALTLPIETDSFWARYHNGRISPSEDRPRMEVTSGTITLRRDSIKLEQMAGELRSSGAAREAVGVPYSVDLEIPRLPKLDWAQRQEWLDDVLASTPFKLNVQLEEFSLTPDASGQIPPVDLPEVVARYLERFNITEGQITTELEISRGESVDGAPARLESHGLAYIQKASGAVQAFRYPLDDVESYVQFDNDRVTIHFLTGVGSQGAPIRVHGVITQPGREASIALSLNAVQVPLDERLRGALKDKQQQLFDALLHQSSHQALAAAEWLPDEATVEQARQELVALAPRLADPPEAGPGATGPLQAHERLHRRARQLQRIVDCGPFALGGSVSLDLNIHREAGPGHRTGITGRIDVQRVGLLYEGFPYPMTVLGGSLQLETDRFVLTPPPGAPGVPITTPGGGHGFATGSIALQRDDAGLQIQPEFELSIAEDQVNRLLYAALPESQDRDPSPPWPVGHRSTAAAMLSDLGLSGALSYRLQLKQRSGADRPRFAADVDLHDGVAAPSADTAARFSTTGLRWPQGWSFEAVNGSVHVTRDRIELRHLSGGNANCQASAAGFTDLSTSPPTTELQVQFDRVRIERFLLDMVPTSTTDMLTELWERYRPAGEVSADLIYQAGPDEPGAMLLTFTPKLMDLEVDHQRVTVARTDGHFVVGKGAVRLENLKLEVHDGNRSAGHMTLNGVYRVKPTDGQERPLELWGSWTNGRLDCPLITEALGRLSDHETLRRFRDLDLDGSFNGWFEYQSAAPGHPADYRVTLHPENLALQLDDIPLYFQFEEGSSVVATPKRVRVHDVRGRHAGGGFTVDGQVVLDPMEIDLSLGYGGQLDSRQFLALLPAVAREAIEAIEFTDGEASVIEQARLRMIRLSPPTATSAAQWRRSFSGQVRTRGSSFNAGIHFTEIDGDFDIAVTAESGLPPAVIVEAKDVQMNLLGATLEGGRARIELVDEGQALAINGLTGSMNGGAVSARARVGLGADRTYDVSAQLAGASLEMFKSSADADADADSEVEPTAAAAHEERKPSAGSGSLFGGVSISGVRGRKDLLRGRGILRAIDNVAEVPVALRVMQLTHLTSPISGPLDYGEAAFYIAGDRMVFERILLESTVGDLAPLQLLGEGQMNLETLQLDTRFRSRGGWLLVRDLVGGIGDQLYLIEVTGPLLDPEAAIVPLPTLTDPGGENRWRETAAVLSP